MNEKRIILLMGAGLMLLCLSFFFAVCFVAMSASGEKYADQIVIAIIGILGIVVGYYFGSSKGSADKSEELAKEAKAVK
jgi:uncharacterized membrane protein